MERRLRGLSCPRPGATPKRRRGPPPPPPPALASDSESDEGPPRRRPPRRASRPPGEAEMSPAAVPDSDPDVPDPDADAGGGSGRRKPRPRPDVRRPEAGGRPGASCDAEAPDVAPDVRWGVKAAAAPLPALRLDSDTDVEEAPPHPDVRPRPAPPASSDSDTDVEGVAPSAARRPDVSAAQNGRHTPGSDTDVEGRAAGPDVAAPGLTVDSDTDAEEPGAAPDVRRPLPPQLCSANPAVSQAAPDVRRPPAPDSGSDTDVEAAPARPDVAQSPSDSDTDVELVAPTPDLRRPRGQQLERAPDVAPPRWPPQGAPNVEEEELPETQLFVPEPDVGGQDALPDVAAAPNPAVQEGGADPDVTLETQLFAPAPAVAPPTRPRPPPAAAGGAGGDDPDVLPQTQLFAPGAGPGLGAGPGAGPAEAPPPTEAPPPVGPRSPGAGEENAGDAEDDPELFLEATQNFLPPAPSLEGGAEEPPSSVGAFGLAEEEEEEEAEPRQPAPPPPRPDAWVPPAVTPPEVGAGLRRSQRLARSREGGASGGGATAGAGPPPGPTPPRRRAGRHPEPQEPPAKRGRGRAEPRPSEPRPARARPQPRPRKAAASSSSGSNRRSQQEPAEPEDAASRPRPQRCPRGPPGSAPPKVLFTGVVAAAGTVAALGLLGGSVAASVFDCTHLVTDRVRRTVKFLCALARGVPIVTPEWLLKSAQSGCALAPGAFLVRDAEQERGLGFNLATALRRARRRGLLEGYEVHVTPNVRPEPELMRDIIACSGGTFLPAMPCAYRPRRLVISCAADAGRWGPALGARLPLASAELLLTGLLRQRLDLEPFRLASPTSPTVSPTSPATSPAAASRPRRPGPRRATPR